MLKIFSEYDVYELLKICMTSGGCGVFEIFFTLKTRNKAEFIKSKGSGICKTQSFTETSHIKFKGLVLKFTNTQAVVFLKRYIKKH